MRKLILASAAILFAAPAFAAIPTSHSQSTFTFAGGVNGPFLGTNLGGGFAANNTSTGSLTIPLLGTQTVTASTASNSNVTANLNVPLGFSASGSGTSSGAVTVP